MRLLLAAAIVLPLAAQAPDAQTAAPPKPDAQKPDASKPAAQSADAAQSPVPSNGLELTGWIDFGYRWRTDVNGSFETYRSIVNLGEGPKLFGLDFTLTDPQHRYFDSLNVRGTTWGGEPYSAFHLDFGKMKWYRFNADYRDLAYFNNLPSYADPLLTRGIMLDEQSFDTRRHIGSYSLELLPGNWIIPYFSYDRDSNSGTGVQAFSASGNEYPVPTNMSDLTNLYRGGLRFELSRFHGTLEGGGTTFKNDQSLYQNPGSANYGNVSTPVFGQTLVLNSLLATYGIRGSSGFMKALMTANIASWLDVYGQFMFSQPESTVNYTETAKGNFYLPSQIIFYQSEQYLVSAAAKLPHTTGNVGFELRPGKRLRITESWLTDRLHNGGNSSSVQTFVPPGGVSPISQLLAASLATNYNQTETNLFFDAGAHVTLRGGYRYVWGDASDAVLPQEGLAQPEQTKLRRNVGLGAVTWRPSAKFLASAEAEIASSGGVYFRTSLYDYQKVRAQARYQATNSVSLALDFNYLNNENPTPGINYNFLAQIEALSISWSPGNSKVFSLLGSYAWSSIDSNILYLVPQTLTQATSNYFEHAHTATGLFTLHLGHWGEVAPVLTAGGALFTSGGSRPTSYYQPLGKLSIPFSKHFQVFGEWWYYGFGEAFYPYEGFTTHLAAVGLRYSR
jgi:hypothetical protein